MDPDAVPGGSRPRVGLVLGAGGVLGAAWMTGALPAITFAKWVLWRGSMRAM